jgi:ribosomal protein S18 acetylase RimI-like enzyme
MTIRLRPVTPEDEPFEIALFDITNDELLSLMALPAEQRFQMSMFQVRAQRESYKKDYPDARTLIIEADDVEIGKYIYASRPDEVLFIDIAIVPGYQSRGIGSLVIQPQLREIFEEGKTGYLRVRHENVRAKSLYERLGFSVIAVEDINYRMAAKAQDLTLSK